MNIIEPSVTVEHINGLKISRKIERCARVAYKSEGKMTNDSYESFLARIIRSGHESTLEHYSFSAIFVVDRGISHELVRHRISSFTQESTRYCNYGLDNEITLIRPFFFPESSSNYTHWYTACGMSQAAYMAMLREGATPQQARSVLPNSLKTEIVVSTNIREWRHIFGLRCAKEAHPQMRQVMIPLLLFCKEQMPTLFDDIEYDKDFNPDNYAELYIDYSFERA